MSSLWFRKVHTPQCQSAAIESPLVVALVGLFVVDFSPIRGTFDPLLLLILLFVMLPLVLFSVLLLVTRTAGRLVSKLGFELGEGFAAAADFEVSLSLDCCCTGLVRVSSHS